MTLVSAKMEGKLYTARGHAKVMRFVNRNRIEFWRDNMLPTHFETNELTRPGGGYGYAPRTKKTQLVKARRYGHQKPNVQTGKLRDTIRLNSRVTATQHQGRFKSRGYFPMTAERRRELEIVTPGQQKVIVSGAKSLYQNAASLPEFHDIIRQRNRG